MSKSTALSVRRPYSPAVKPIDPTPLEPIKRHELEHFVLAKLRGTPRFLMRELFEYLRGRCDCWPTNRTIEDDCGISRRNVAYLLRELEKLEVIKCVRCPDISTQRRIVLLDHPNSLRVLKTLGALPSYLDRFVREGMQPLHSAIGGGNAKIAGPRVQ